MVQRKKVLNIILWTARILGALSIIFLAYMTIGEFVGTHDQGTGLTSKSDMVALSLFPISTIIGLLIAFKWKAIGGLITVMGMISLHVIRPDLATNLLISSFAIPGLLYLIYAVWSKR